MNLGFTDFERIQTHDDLAYVRIQKEFDEFRQNQYRRVPGSLINQSGAGNDQNNIAESPLVLEQLEKLTSLRDRGLLTQEEFEREHKKLVR